MLVKVALTVVLSTSIASCNAVNLHAAGAARRHNNHIVKRSAPFSNYDISTGEVACGGFYSANDNVVALNAGMFDGGSHCGKEVSITYNGQTKTATIVDECMKCANGLDLTFGLFQEFASLDVGVFDGTWSYGSGAAAPAPEPKTTSTKEKPTPTPTPTPTPKPEPKTTSTSKVHTTSTTSTTPTSTSTSTTSTSSAKLTSSSSSLAAETSSSVAAVPTALGVQLGLGTQITADISGTQNLVALNNAVLSLGSMAVV